MSDRPDVPELIPARMLNEFARGWPTWNGCKGTSRTARTPWKAAISIVGSTRKAVTCRPQTSLPRKVRETGCTRGRCIYRRPRSDSPKCPRCSLCGICLPDETNLLRLEGKHGEGPDESHVAPEPRRLLAARDDALPLYVHSSGTSTRVGKSGDELVITPREGPKQTARLGQTSQVSLFGQVQISTQAVEAALGRGIPICYFSFGGWFYGMTDGLWHKNVELRRLQYRCADSRLGGLGLARSFIGAKIRNCRTFLSARPLASTKTAEASDTICEYDHSVEEVSQFLNGSNRQCPSARELHVKSAQRMASCQEPFPPLTSGGPIEACRRSC